MIEETKTTLLLKRLLETTQDVFIFQSLKSGESVHVIKSVLHIDTDRVTRISKLFPKKSRNKESDK